MFSTPHLARSKCQPEEDSPFLLIKALQWPLLVLDEVTNPLRVVAHFLLWLHVTLSPCLQPHSLWGLTSTLSPLVLATCPCLFLTSFLIFVIIPWTLRPQESWGLRPQLRSSTGQRIKGGCGCFNTAVFPAGFQIYLRPVIPFFVSMSPFSECICLFFSSFTTVFQKLFNVFSFTGSQLEEKLCQMNLALIFFYTWLA